MIFKSGIVIFIVLVCHSFTGGHSQITCYNCNSFRDGIYGRDCLNPMSPSVPVITCPRNYVCSRVSYVTQKTFVTSRSCDQDSCSSIRNTLQGMYPDLASFNCNTCRSNYCNAGWAVTIKDSSLITVTLGAILIKLL